MGHIPHATQHEWAVAEMPSLVDSFLLLIATGNEVKRSCYFSCTSKRTCKSSSSPYKLSMNIEQWHAESCSMYSLACSTTPVEWCWATFSHSHQHHLSFTQHCVLVSIIFSAHRTKYYVPITYMYNWTSCPRHASTCTLHYTSSCHSNPSGPLPTSDLSRTNPSSPPQDIPRWVYPYELPHNTVMWFMRCLNTVYKPRDFTEIPNSQLCYLGRHGVAPVCRRDAQRLILLSQRTQVA